MEAPSYTDTILLEANRKSSAEYLAGNYESNNAWTNDLGSGVKLEIGDTISVHSAFISEIGNEDSTIEIKGKNAINNLGERQSYTTVNVSLTRTDGEKNNGSTTQKLQFQEGNRAWDYTTTTNTHTIRDDEIHLTHSYYKCAQGDNYMTLPRKWASDDKEGWFEGARVWSEYNTSKTGAVFQANPYRLGSDYTSTRYYGQENGYGYNTSEDGHGQIQRTEIANDGSRFTLFVRKSFKNYVPEGQKTGFYLQGERDPALMDFIWYKKTVKYEVTNGFNSPANVSTQITNKMKDAIDIDNYSYGEENESASAGEEYTRRDGQIKSNFINLQAQSNTYELFPCATAWMIKSAGDHWFNDTYSFSKKINLTTNGNYYLANKQNQTIWEDKTTAFGDFNLYPGDRLIGIERNGNIENQYIPGLMGATVGAVRVMNAGTRQGLAISFAQHSTATVDLAGARFDYLFSDEHTPSWYESCYSTVGYKRPEIQEAGRELMDNDKFGRGTCDGCYQTAETMTFPLSSASGDKKSTIITSMLWTDDNLKLLKKLFDAEGLHPELFDYEAMSGSQQEMINQTDPEKISVNTMRFLHMNDKDGDNKELFEGIYDSIEAPVDTPIGNYIILEDTIGLHRGARLQFSEDDEGLDPSKRFFPQDTFVTSVSGSNVYLSNPYNASYVPDIKGSLFFTQQGLGNDYYYTSFDRVEFSHHAAGCFFDYNPARKDDPTGEGLGPNVYESLTYGFAKKVTLDDVEFIGFSVEKYQDGTIPQEWFLNDEGTYYIRNRAIGFDKHFNAYGTAAILLYNGYASLWGCDYNASTIEGSTFTKGTFTEDGEGRGFQEAPFNDVGRMFKTFQFQPTFDGWFFNTSLSQEKYGPGPPLSPEYARLYNEMYCGANQPSLQFDSQSSRFSFTNLHTPELIGTNAESVKNGSDVADSNTPCFKLNKRLSRLTYSPNFTPYNNVFKVSGSNQLDNVQIEKDQNTVPYAIMDAQSGIYIEDYGCDEANWSQSLWELMGFTYSQFHNFGSRLQRFNNTELTTATPTTNALIKTEDLQNLVTRGQSHIPINNSLELNYPFWRYSASGVLPTGSAFNTKWYEACLSFPGHMSYPPTTQQAESTSIIAENLPRKMLSPIYLIKSDLLNPTYIGGREGTSSLPIIAVVDKSSGYGDYFNGATDSTIFTNTIPRTIQNIKTSIVEADGSTARVDDGSCVIYKITKQIKSNKYVLENILNPQPPQK